MEKLKHNAVKIDREFSDITKKEIWADVFPISIDKYRWMDNGYAPEISVKIFHTERYIYLKYHVVESRITISHTTFGAPVYKDSCVEFFLNPFPESSEEYVNIEINALGVMLIGVGKDGDDSKRYYFKQNEVKEFEIISTIKKPVKGFHGKDFWELYLKIPKSFFEKHYDRIFVDKNTIANFYKCGDETEFEHYGAWSEVQNPTPNFHLPEYFGELIFNSSSFK